MNWLERLSRNAGLMIHHVMHPGHTKQPIHQKVEEKKLNDTVTLRRITIDEIEVNTRGTADERR